MREIKFRVRDAGTKELLGYENFNTSLNNGYYYVDLREPVDDGEGGVDYICKTEFSENPMLKPKHPLGQLLREQFTGLKDKNGVEIYEGDIVTCNYFAGSKVKQHNEVVEFKSGQFELTWTINKLFKSFRSRSCFHGHPDAFEVIGNIYENPELLEQ